MAAVVPPERSVHSRDQRRALGVTFPCTSSLRSQLQPHQSSKASASLQTPNICVLGLFFSGDFSAPPNQYIIASVSQCSPSEANSAVAHTIVD